MKAPAAHESGLILTLGLRSMKTNVNSEHGKKVADIILLFIKLLKLFKIYE